jgi:hypothetical protein
LDTHARAKERKRALFVFSREKEEEKRFLKRRSSLSFTHARRLFFLLDAEN